VASQLTLFVSEYDRLVEQRDFAAYRALGSISAAIVFCRENDTQRAITVLSRALLQYERAETAARTFKIERKENNVDRIAAA
jgi:hypothetical protein